MSDACESGLLCLPDELLVQVASHCDADNLASLEQVCTQLRKVCHSRGIWQSLLLAAGIQSCPNFPFVSDISSLPVSKVRSSILIGKQRRRAWISESRAHRLNVKSLLFPASPEAESVSEPRLLPGGKHLVLLNQSQLQIWSIDPQKCVWEAPRSMGYECCMAFAFELVDEGRKLRVVTIDVDVESRANVTHLRVLTYDFEQRMHKVEFENLVPLVFLFHLKLCGDFVLCPVIPDESRAMLLNWRTREKLLLDLNDEQERIQLRPHAYLLTPECVIAILKLKKSGFSAVAFPLDAFSKWFTIDDFWDYQAWKDSIVAVDVQNEESTITPLPFQGANTGNGEADPDAVLTGQLIGPVMLATHVFVSSWLPQKPTEIIVAAFDSSSNELQSTPLLSYHLRIMPRLPGPSRSQKPLMRLMEHKCITASKLPWNPRSLSNDGHMFFLADTLRCFALFESKEQPVKEINVSPDIFKASEYPGPVMSAVEPWSGAIVIWLEQMVKIVRVLLA